MALIWGVWIYLVYVQSACGDGFRNSFQDSAAIAQGNAFRAQADNPSAVFYNPAGMTQLSGIQYSTGVQFINVDTEFRHVSGTRVENDLGGFVGLPPPGQLFLTGNFSSIDLPVIKNISLGVGVQSLYGFSTKYPKDGPFATLVTKAQLPLLDIKPSVAYKFHERLSVGFGLDIFTFASFLGEGRSVQQFMAVGNIPGTIPGQVLELSRTGTTVGVNASMLWTPWMTEHGKPRMNIGFVWRNRAKLPINGGLLVNGDKVAATKTAFQFPDSYEWGVAVWPLRNDKHEWKVEVDVDYVRWSSVKNFDVSFADGSVLPNPQNWSNVVTVGMGTEWKWMKHTILPNWDHTLRAGYLRSHSPIPNQNINPAFPDANVNSITAGFGLVCHEDAKFLWFLPCKNAFTNGIGLDVAYLFSLWEPRNITNHPHPGLNGKFKTTAHFGSVTLRFLL